MATHTGTYAWHQGIRVLELGCGCGLVGLCYAACGADVLMTDLPETMVSGMRFPRQHTSLEHTLSSHMQPYHAT